jgi:hypothetical protein
VQKTVDYNLNKSPKLSSMDGMNDINVPSDVRTEKDAASLLLFLSTVI